MSAAVDPVPESFEVPDVAGVEDLLSTFLDPERPHLTDGEIAEGVQALDRVRCLVDAALTAGVDRLDGCGIYGSDGARSAAAWLRPRTELSAAHASELVHRAFDLRSTPHVDAAFGSGLDVAKVRMLLKARDGLEDLFAEHEEELVAFIRDLTVEQARIAISRWRARAEATKRHDDKDDDGPPPDPETGNEAHLSQHFEGRFRLDADFDPVTGQQIADAIEARIDDMYRNGIAFAGDGVKRSRRAAQALAELILRGAETGTTKQGAPRPSIILNIDLAALLGLPVDSPEELLARGCGLSNGTPVAPAAVDRLLCTADVTALFTKLGLNGIVEPLGAAHANRYPTAAERKALALRDQGCVFPGCDAPVSWSDAHHLDHWHLHQRTELGRLVLLCRFHHHCVHDGGYTLDRSPTGIISVTRPDGSTLPNPQPGHLILEPDEPAGTEPSGAEHDGTGPPETGPPGHQRPTRRFRTVAERKIAAEREDEWWNDRVKARLDALINSPRRAPDPNGPPEPLDRRDDPEAA